MPSKSDATAILSKETNAFKAWILAARPKTLLVSLPPIMIGTALAARQVEHLNWIVVLFALLCSLGVHIGTNLVNDAIDFKRGADAVGRLGPKRVTQEGIFTYRQVITVAYSSFAFALICGIPLMWIGGWPIAFILMLSVACGYLYTGGPFSLAYTGISDVFVLIFFGWVSTETVYFLLTGKIDLSSFVAATQIGLLAVVPLAINNLRDHVSDARVNKKTLAVRFGQQFARWEITLLSFTPFFLGFFWLIEGSLWMALLPFLVLPLIVRNVQSIWKTNPSPLYNQFLAKSALCQLLFASLLVLGILIN